MSAWFGGPRPMTREVRPDNYANISNIAPSSPSTSPKVRFAATPTGDPIAGVSRPLKRVEASSLFYFENHARQCEACRYLASSHRSSSRGNLCSTGYSLALDVACHVQYLNGDICSREREREGVDFARVEVPHDYVMLRQLLKNMDRGARRHHRPPVVSYEPPMYSARRPSSSSSSAAPFDDLDMGRVAAVIEPSHSSSHRRRHRSRYSTVAVVDDDDEFVGERPTYKHRRGTLYEKDAQRKREAYCVEIHEPRNSKRSSGWS